MRSRSSYVSMGGLSNSFSKRGGKIMVNSYGKRKKRKFMRDSIKDGPGRKRYR